MTERAESERSEGIDPGKVQALEQAFRVDPLSGLPILSEEWSNGAAVEAFADLAATGAPISFVIGDLDRFRTVNATGGHALCDEVLRVVRETVALNARWQDVVFRGGGDRPRQCRSGQSRTTERVRARMRCCCATGGAMDIRAETAIRELVERLQALQAQVEPFIALHTTEAVVVNFGGRRVLGRDDLRAAMERALASPLAEVTTTNEVHDIRFVRPDVAIVSCTKHVSDQRDTSDKFATSGSSTYVVVEDDGAWRVALAQTTPIQG